MTPNSLPDLMTAILERPALHACLLDLEAAIREGDAGAEGAFALELTPLLRDFGLQGPLDFSHPTVQAVRFALLLRQTDGHRDD